MIDNKKLTQLMDDYGDFIFRTCYMYLSDYTLAEDATQETFIKAMRGIESFRKESSEKTWLASIANNVCKNIYRTKWFELRKNMNSTDDNQNENILNISDIKNENFDENIIRKNSILEQIRKLSYEDREVIILYYYQELSIKEISNITKDKENTVAQRLKRAREKLKVYLKEAGYGKEEYA